MTFLRIRSPGAWINGSTVQPSEFEAIDDTLSKCVDGDAGGSYAPSARLIFGGAGVQFDGPAAAIFNADISAGHIAAASQQVTSSTLHDVAVDGDADFSVGNVEFHNTVQFFGTPEFRNGFTTGTAGTATFNRPVRVEAAAGTLTNLATLVQTGAAQIGGTLSVTGTGQIISRVVNATDADTHYNAVTHQVVQCPPSTLGANRTWWIDELGAVVGSRLELSRLNDTSAFDVTVRRDTDSVVLATLHTGISGEGLRSVEIIYTTSGWRVLHFHGAP